MIHERVDLAGATVAYITAAVAGVKDHELADYLPRWGEVEPQPVDEMVAALRRLAQREGP